MPPGGQESGVLLLAPRSAILCLPHRHVFLKQQGHQAWETVHSTPPLTRRVLLKMDLLRAGAAWRLERWNRCGGIPLR